MCALFGRWYAFLIAIAIFGATAASPASAQYCPEGQKPVSTPPTQNVVVTVVSVRPNSDMEGDDDYVPFYDNRADIYGTVTIDGESFALPQIEDSDHPHWPEGKARFVKHVEGGLIPIKVAIREADSGATGGDDWVDVSPDANKDTLELTFDTCSLKVTGDVAGSGQGKVIASGGTGAEDGTIHLRVEMEDGRAITANDLSLTNFDLIQVVPQVDRIVAAKPMVGMVRVANNTPSAWPVSVRVQIFGQNDALVHDVTESLGDPIEPGEVRKKYLFEGAPLKMADIGRPYPMRAVARILHQNNESAPSPNDPSPRCRIINDSSGSLAWTVVSTQHPDVLWIRVSALLDATDFVDMQRVRDLRELSEPFMNGIFPVASTAHDTSSFPLVLPAAAVQDFVYALVQVVGIPADSLLPFTMTFELNGVAAITGHDRVIGVVRHNWFDRFRYGLWAEKSGVSLATFAPRAVIVQATKGQGADIGPAMSLPVHELGHTYGLSVDPTLKNTWACNVSGGLGVLLCGAAGGFDEYLAEGVPYDGNPTGGYWVQQGPFPQALMGALGEQCAFCTMGNNPANIHKNWVVLGRWIDLPDYNHLLDRLTVGASAQAFIIQPQQYVYLSGILAGDDRALLSSTYRLLQRPRVVDFARNDRDDVYAIRFMGPDRRMISQVTFPPNWNRASGPQMAMTFFAGTAALPRGTRVIEVWNRKSRKRLAVRAVSLNPPALGAPAVAIEDGARGRELAVSWAASDADGDKLTHFVHIRKAGGGSWWPLAHEAAAPALRAPLADIPPGSYELRVISSDGVNLAERLTPLVVPRRIIRPPVNRPDTNAPVIR
jgi:hypothetical protein